MVDVTRSGGLGLRGSGFGAYGVKGLSKYQEWRIKWIRQWKMRWKLEVR